VHTDRVKGWVASKVQWLGDLQRKSECTPIKIERVYQCFRHPSSPTAREPISVTILYNLLRKNGVMMQKANVGHGGDREDDRLTLCPSLKVVRSLRILNKR
jgi:hypothetical protein